MFKLLGTALLVGVLTAGLSEVASAGHRSCRCFCQPIQCAPAAEQAAPAAPETAQASPGETRQSFSFEPQPAAQPAYVAPAPVDRHSRFRATYGRMRLLYGER